MTQYTQLSQDERYEIYAALKSNTSIPQLALEIGRSKSTIYREIDRNSGKRGYRPKQAHLKAQQTRYRKTSDLTDFAYEFISHLLKALWSPEQIAGALSIRGWLDVPSHTWIYDFIRQNKAQGGSLYKYLRRRKKYRKHGFESNDLRGKIANRQSIHCREGVIEQRQRLGDFEGDTIIGKQHKGAVLTLVERKSLYTMMSLLGATRVSKVTIDHCLVRLRRAHALSVTFDNGKEFAEHERLKQQGIDTYFADPYKSNQRARNENTNGLIRQYLPKSSSFEHVTNEQIRYIEDALNSRPRKSLGWYTPSDVMANFYTVALVA